MTISSRRNQQGHFNAALAMNKFAGTGAGSGMFPQLLLGQGHSSDTSVNLSGAAFQSISGVPFSFQVDRTMAVQFVFNATGRVTSSGAGFYAYGFFYLDGAVLTDPPYLGAIWDKQNAGYVYAGAMVIMPPGSCSIGKHALDFRIGTDDANTHWLQYGTFIYAFGLGR